MQRRGCHEADDRRTIRIRNQRPLPTPELDSFHGLRINLRYHKRHPLVHPESGAVIHNDCALLRRNRPELLAYAPAGAEQGNVDAVEAVRRQFLDGVIPVLVGDRLSGGAFGGEQLEGSVGEVAVGDDGEELLADGAGDSDDGDGGAVLSEGHSDGEGAIGGGSRARDGEGGGFGEEGGGEVVVEGERGELHFCDGGGWRRRRRRK